MERITLKHTPRRKFEVMLLALLLVCGIRPIRGFASSKSSYSPDTSDTTKRLLEHLEEQECEGLETTQLGFDAAGLRGIFATEDFEPGDYICAIPFPATLLVSESINSDESQVEQGQKFLDKFVDEDAFKYYMDCLPHLGKRQFDATPDFWEESIIQEFQIPRLVKESLDRKRETSCKTNLQWAAWIVGSRGFSTFQIKGGNKLLKRTVLIPYLDMLNHGLSPNASIEVVECPGSYQDSFFALQALDHISAGEQITINYGIRETSLDLISKYGFWIPDNPADEYMDWKTVDPQWTTTLAQDEAALERTSDATFRQVLLLRIHLKRQQHSESP